MSVSILLNRGTGVQSVVTVKSIDVCVVTATSIDACVVTATSIDACVVTATSIDVCVVTATSTVSYTHLRAHET